MIGKPNTKTLHDLHWYIVQCKPNSVQIAVHNLEYQSFGTFLPLEEFTKRKGKVFHRQIRPLFPGYLFVQLDPAQGPWRKVNNTRGVSRLVHLGAKPSVVPNSVVEALMAVCDERSILHQTNETLLSKVHTYGQARVTQGPFSGFVATVANIEPNNRIQILIEVMGQGTRVEIDAGALQPIG
ncbi:transcriptional activator RfaH [Alphaproteobacteria bacterium]|jgi:transcriptional antiterminator RfaH|nr:transcriptional activator RfaH [Alphaproteobacteria bacterium]